MFAKNNILNIRYSARSKWIGLGSPAEIDGFCNFTDVKFCVRAGAIIVMHSLLQGRTYQQMLCRLCPDSDIRDSLLSYVCRHANVLPFDIPVNKRQVAELLYWVARYLGSERYNLYSNYDVPYMLSVIDEFKLRFTL